MTYTNLQLIRKLISDPYKHAFDSQVGDDEARKFQLSHKPVLAGSYTVYLDDVEIAEDTDYTLDTEMGIVTMTSVPTAGQEVEIDYQYSVFSDTEITEFLTLDNDDVNKVVVRLIEILLADSARRFDYSQGKTDMKPSQVFANLKDLLKIYLDKVSGTDNTIRIVSMKNDYFEQPTVQEIDLTRSDL